MPSLLLLPRSRPGKGSSGQITLNGQNGRVNSNKVIFSWLTNATFGAAVNGHVVLLDSFVTRLEVVPGRTPFVIQDLVDLQPEAIFLGHGHFDHADNAAYIAAQTGATIYATPETCDNMAIDATNNFNNHFTAVATASWPASGPRPGARSWSRRSTRGCRSRKFSLRSRPPGRGSRVRADPRPHDRPRGSVDHVCAAWPPRRPWPATSCSPIAT